jgi:hypothetical protein
MALTLRFTAASSDYRDWLDYTIVEDGCRDVGRPYEDSTAAPSCGGFGLSRSSPRSSSVDQCSETLPESSVADAVVISAVTRNFLKNNLAGR